MTTTAPTAAPDPLVNYRLEMIEKSISTMSENLLKLTTLEQKYHEGRESLLRAFSAIDRHDARLAVIETELPTLKLTRGWVITGVTAVLGMNGGMLFLAVKFMLPHAA